MCTHAVLIASAYSYTTEDTVSLLYPKLFQYVADSCNSEWKMFYAGVISDLVAASQPQNGSECPKLGETAESGILRNMNELHILEFGKTVKESLSHSQSQMEAQMTVEREHRQRIKEMAREQRENRRKERMHL